MRRALLQSLLAMAGDGLRRPVNAPPESVIPVGVQPGAQSPVVTANRIIVSGANGGVFIYLGTPSLGNPPIDWMTNATTDPFGNALPSQGVGTQQSGSNWASLFSGAAWLGDNLTTQPNAAAASGGSGMMLLKSGLTGVSDNAAFIELFSKNSGGGSVAASITLGSAVTATVGTPAAPTLITTDVWNTLGALAAGSGYTVNNGRFQLCTDGRVEIDINLTAGAATVAGNYAFATALPAGQRPPFQCSYIIGFNGTTAAGVNTTTLRVSTAGAVTLQLPVLPNGTVLSTTQRIPTS